jgi:hypothetical protein
MVVGFPYMTLIDNNSQFTWHGLAISPSLMYSATTSPYSNVHCVEKVRKVSYADVVRGTHPESSTVDDAVHWHVVKGKKNKRADERPRNLSFSQAN